MALIPAPPAPTTCTRRGRDGRGRRPLARRTGRPPPMQRPCRARPGARAWASDHRHHGRDGVGPSHRWPPAAAMASRRRLGRRAARQLGARRAPSHSESVDDHGGAGARSSTSALARWWSPGAPGSGHEDGGIADDGQLGHRVGAGPRTPPRRRPGRKAPCAPRGRPGGSTAPPIGPAGRARLCAAQSKSRRPDDVVERHVAARRPAVRPARAPPR